MEGKADYTPSNVEGMGERLHLIGDASSPIYICKKKDVPKLFNRIFWQIYTMWDAYHSGFGLPMDCHWTKQDPDLLRIISAMQTHYDRHFSLNSVGIKYLEAIIKRVDLLRAGK